MLDSLRFVQGAVAKKDFVQALTHFSIKGRRILGFNGMLGLSGPIDLDLDIKPKATDFIKAIQTCGDETIALSLTKAGRLSIKAGKFKAFIDCLIEEYPTLEPEGETVVPTGGFQKALKILAPFIADDASRPWARGILFRGQSAFATNNVVLVEHWLGHQSPVDVNIPRAAVMELLRIGEEPTHLQVSENSVTFHFSGDRWLRTQTYSTEWPDLTRILDRPAQPFALPEGIFDAAESLTPFVDEFEKLYITPTGIATSNVEGIGAGVDIPGIALTHESCFNIKHFNLLEGVVKTIDLEAFPNPCLFYGDNIRGAIMGMRPTNG